ncbi:MAG: oligosaccharide flippase family protein [Actinobacteria bacterium]|nr:oligosaccharide flippase family protein [Actinomycetota bacterium]
MRIIKDKIFKQTTILLIALMIGNVSNYLFNVLMGKMLGPSNYSNLTSLLSLFVIISVPTGTIQMVITNYVSKYKAEGDYPKIKFLLVKSIKKLSFYGIIGFLIFLMSSGLVASFLKIPSITPVIILGLILLFSVISPVNHGALQGLQEFNYLGIDLSLGALLKFVFGVILVSLGLGVSGAIAGFAFGGFVALFLSFYFLRSVFRIKNSDEVIDKVEMYRHFWPTLITLFCFAVLTNIDLVLVKHFFSSVSASYYSAAVVIGRIALFLPGAVSMVMFPKTSELYAKKQDSSVVLKKSLLATFLLSGSVVIAYFLFPVLVIKFIFGSKFLAGSGLLGIIGIAMTFFALDNVLLSYNLSIHNYEFIKMLVFCTILQVVLILFFHKSLSQVVYVLILSSILLFVSTLNYKAKF